MKMKNPGTECGVAIDRSPREEHDRKTYILVDEKEYTEQIQINAPRKSVERKD
jgi:hypothetical protein